MEISRDSLLRIVKAARIAKKQAEAMENLLIDKNAWTLADEIEGQLSEALFILSGEQLKPEQNFSNSRTALLLESEMSDGDVADWYLMMDRLNKRINPEQPKPNVISREQLRKMHEANHGGYLSPEG